LKIRKDGFVLVDDLLAMKKFKNLKVEDIEKLVNSNDKQRFKLMTENGSLFIRANQGHSMEGIEVSMNEITKDDKIEVCVHGTYKKSIEIILKEGLCKMSRQHIHFAVGLPGESGKKKLQN
jgi:2'-phosphotransferase